ncbi:hypothetical protein F4802DRAFT_150776 [Xylaria palmicola]|nr:hypothetical protein F4802DRAFT_150776 [Xylaria palmicola]
MAHNEAHDGLDIGLFCLDMSHQPCAKEPIDKLLDWDASTTSLDATLGDHYAGATSTSLGTDSMMSWNSIVCMIALTRPSANWVKSYTTTRYRQSYVAIGTRHQTSDIRHRARGRLRSRLFAAIAAIFEIPAIPEATAGSRHEAYTIRPVRPSRLGVLKFEARDPPSHRVVAMAIINPPTLSHPAPDCGAGPCETPAKARLTQSGLS